MKKGDKMDKWDYISKISKSSDRYGNKLILLMDTYDRSNLQEITLTETKEFWNKIEEDLK